jgi:crossover junction endodeoxyribonuclease RuvC
LSVIIGIDPGSRVTGYGLVERRGSGIFYVASGIIKPGASASMPGKLTAIKSRIDEVLSEFNPVEMAVEDLFISKNPKSALKLGQIRGIVILAAAEAGIEVFEYSPREVKGSVTGSGSAHKSQVASMVLRLLESDHVPAAEDETDALAVAFCHAARSASPAGRPL